MVSKRLCDRWLAKREKNGLPAPSPSTLDEVAARRGTLGAGEEQRQLHQRQREQYLAWLKQLKTRKS
jgi:hypothetical protein